MTDRGPKGPLSMTSPGLLRLLRGLLRHASRAVA